jgi:hypothetical protein
MGADAWATAIRRRGLLLFHPCSQQKPGALIGTPPWIVLSGAASSEEIAVAVKHALDESRSQIEVANVGAFLNGRYKALGVRSEDEFMSDAECLGLRRSCGVILVTPTENGLHMWHKNFRHLTDSELRIPEGASERAIGEAIQHGWDACC